MEKKLPMVVIEKEVSLNEKIAKEVERLNNMGVYPSKKDIFALLGKISKNEKEKAWRSAYDKELIIPMSYRSNKMLAGEHRQFSDMIPSKHLDVVIDAKHIPKEFYLSNDFAVKRKGRREEAELLLILEMVTGGREFTEGLFIEAATEVLQDEDEAKKWWERYKKRMGRFEKEHGNQWNDKSLINEEWQQGVLFGRKDTGEYYLLPYVRRAIKNGRIRDVTTIQRVTKESWRKSRKKASERGLITIKDKAAPNTPIELRKDDRTPEPEDTFLKNDPTELGEKEKITNVLIGYNNLGEPIYQCFKVHTGEALAELRTLEKDPILGTFLVYDDQRRIFKERGFIPPDQRNYVDSEMQTGDIKKALRNARRELREKSELEKASESIFKADFDPKMKEEIVVYDEFGRPALDWIHNYDIMEEKGNDLVVLRKTEKNKHGETMTRLNYEIERRQKEKKKNKEREKR